MDKPESLVELLSDRANRQPDKRVFTFLRDGEEEACAISYRELDAGARRVASLIAQKAAPGDRAVLLYPTGLDFIYAFWGCLYAGIIAVPLSPPHRTRNLSRLQGVLTAAAPKLVLTTSGIVRTTLAHAGVSSLVAGCSLIASDEISWEEDPQFVPFSPRGDSIAFLQFTSGSTGKGKGVIVSHANVVANQRMIQLAFGHDEQAVVCGWLPLYHDMGLIGNMLQPVWLGGTCILMGPLHFLQKPSRWLSAISKYRATTSGAPNFAYDLCVRKIAPDEIAHLDLSCWRVAFNGAEPVRAATLQRFSDTFARAGFNANAFTPCYGLAEATLLVTSKHPAAPVRFMKVDKGLLQSSSRLAASSDSDSESSVLTSCGKTYLDGKVHIVCPDSDDLCAEGEVGEIVVSGSNVCAGYWNNAEATSAAFPSTRSLLNGLPCLRTGDLGSLVDGELFITGRAKDVIIVHGKNHYAHDLEATVEECHPSLQGGLAVAFAVDTGSEEGVVIWQELGNHLETAFEQVAKCLHESILSEHGINLNTVVLLQRNTLPRTTSGKKRRLECRERYLTGDYSALYSWTGPAENDATPEPAVSVSSYLETSELLGSLIGIFARQLKISERVISADATLISLGVDSLGAAELSHEIEKCYGIRIGVETILSQRSVGVIAEMLEKLLVDSSATAPTDPEKPISNKFPMSYGQRDIWTIQQMMPPGRSMTISRAVRVEGLNKSSFVEAVQSLTRMHPALRTTFHKNEETDEFFQWVHDTAHDCGFRTEKVEKTALQSHLLRAAEREIHVDVLPLLQIEYLDIDEGEGVLLFVAHHIIVDYVSFVNLFRDLFALYEKPGSVGLVDTARGEYDDFVRRQFAYASAAEGKADLEYWKSKLKALPLPADLTYASNRRNQRAVSGQGKLVRFVLDPTTTSLFKNSWRGLAVTPFSLGLAIFNALVFRYTDLEDIAVSVPHTGRTREFWPSVGYYVNPLLLRAKLDGATTGRQLIKAIHAELLNALKHSQVPYAYVKSEINRTEGSRFNAPRLAFIWHSDQIAQAPTGIVGLALNQSRGPFSYGGLGFEAVELESESTSFDVEFSLGEIEGVIAGTILFRSDLFPPEWDVGFADNLAFFSRQLLENIDRPLQSLDVVSQEEMIRLNGWSDRRQWDWPSFCLHTKFEDLAAAHPERLALVGSGLSLTYQQLNEGANALARQLLQAELPVGTRVLVVGNHRVAQITSLLATLKAGLQFLCLENPIPPQRLAAIVGQASPRALVFADAIPDSTKIPDGILSTMKCIVRVEGTRIIEIELNGRAVENGAVPDGDSLKINPHLELSVGAPAYTVYTSGSTGVPKGMVHTHHSFSQFIQWQDLELSLGSGARVGQFAALSFDVSYCEIFGALCFGGTLCVIDPRDRINPVKVAEWIATERVEILQIIPSFFKVVLDTLSLDSHFAAVTALRSLKKILFVGEVLAPDLVAQIRKVLGSAPILFNLYGPSETVAACCYKVAPHVDQLRSIPIGTPMGGRCVTLLNGAGKLCPVGSKGTIHIRSRYTARGYIDPTENHRFYQSSDAEDSDDWTYNSGDSGRWLADGNLEFCGRIDHQVKVRGVRVELEEIEAAYNRHPLVEHCVVTASEGMAGIELTAFVKARGALSLDELKTHIRGFLPEAVDAAQIVFVRDFQRNANGKIDRSALLKGDVSRDPDAVRPPSVDEETKVVSQQLGSIWREILKIEQSTLDDNFFNKGGNSILAALLVNRIKRELGIGVDLSAFWLNPTLRNLARLTETHRESSEAESREILQLISEIDRMTDNEVNALMEEQKR